MIIVVRKCYRTVTGELVKDSCEMHLKITLVSNQTAMTTQKLKNLIILTCQLQPTRISPQFWGKVGRLCVQKIKVKKSNK